MRTESTHPTLLRRAAAVSAVALAAAVALTFGASGTAHAAAKKKPTTKKATSTAKSKIAAGGGCTTLGANDAGSGLDCVSVGKALQWQPRGVRVNPFHLNDAIEYNPYETDRFRLRVVGTAPLTAADIGAPADARPPIPAGSAPLLVKAELTYLGPRPEADPAANLTGYEVVDANDKVYALYADQACSQYGALSNDPYISLRHAPANAVQSGGFCVVVPTPVVPGLLLKVRSIQKGTELWFKLTG